MTCSFRPYEGEEPYIFASYSHRDSGRVVEILNHLASSGFRIWFDEGIEWGSEWPESIANRLDGCSVCMVFISGSSVQSANCRQEIRYALKQGKSILSVYLEEVVLSKGMDMQLSPYQQTYPYQYSDFNEFLKRLDETPVLQPCRAALSEHESGGDPSPAGEEKADAPAAGKKKLPTLAFICAGALAVLALVLGLALGRAGSRQGDQENSPGSYDSPVVPEEPDTPSTPETPEEPEEPEPPEEVLPPYHVVLSAGDLSIKEYPTALEILRGRLDALADGIEYQMTVDGSTIDLVVPRDMIVTSNLNSFLLSVLTRPLRLYAVCEADESVYTEISREDIAGAKAVTGLIDGVSPEDLGLEGDSYKYIELTLTDGAAARLAKQTADWGPVFIGEDVPEKSWFYFDSYLDEDWRTIRLVTSQRCKMAESLVYSYSNPTFEHQFQFTIMLNDVVWDEPEDASAHPNQCGGEMEGETVTLDLNPIGDITEGEWIDTKAAIQTRLEALGQPYALGARMEEERSLCIMTSPERLGDEIISLLNEQTAYIRLRTGMYSIGYSFKGMEVTRLEDGRFAMLLSLDDYNLEKLKNQVATSGDDEILFILGSTAYLGGSLSDGTLVLDSIPFLGLDSISEDMSWYLDFLNVFITGPVSGATMDVSIEQFSDTENGAYGIVNSGLVAAQEELRKVVAGISKDASIGFNEATAYVALNLPVDEELPERSLELIQRIYEAVDFPESPFDNLTFYLCKEDNSEGERARIYFLKSYSVTLDSPGTIYVNGVLANGRLEAIKDVFRETMESSDFIQSMTDADYTRWSY